jgi:hypothetical protein
MNEQNMNISTVDSNQDRDRFVGSILGLDSREIIERFKKVSTLIKIIDGLGFLCLIFVLKNAS